MTPEFKNQLLEDACTNKKFSKGVIPVTRCKKVDEDIILYLQKYEFLTIRTYQIETGRLEESEPQDLSRTECSEA